MNTSLDQQLTALAVKWKNLVVVDTHFAESSLKEFCRHFEERCFHLSGADHLAPAFASGLASLGLRVVVFGPSEDSFSIDDPSLCVKLITQFEASDHLEETLASFGPAVI